MEIIIMYDSVTIKSTVDRMAPEKLADVLGRDLVLRIQLFVRFLDI